ncbi:MAG: TonB-dependent receptor [Gammaproteobacteria bacterium]|nr:TonB-dependent receptor [Gammaproteobacteria bacterium]MBT5724345.1 TonB-dependent receptor [Gammaproteobacteria bacterium]MBT6585204.1 TonB-dependent receptor [Gammaproteobacteria bacterium]
MLQEKKFALTPVAAAVSAAFVPTPSYAAESSMLEEVVVTARKRAESAQDIPASVQALSEDLLKDMGARGMADYSRFVPAVNVVSYGNGSSTIVFRGATIEGGGYIAQSTSSVYLDEISVTSTGSQPSIRMVDIERVEALAGPQGTIYGSDAQAGTMRIITNKPEMNRFSADIDVGVRGNKEGEASYDSSVVFNFPLVEDKLALRVVGFSAKDGGYIDNVLANTPSTSLVGNQIAGFGTLDNSEYVGKDKNDSEISGWRAALRWEVNENWAVSLSAIHQETNNGFYNDYDPSVGDLETVKFYDDHRDDEYDMYSLTIEADLGFAQLVSATSYYEREIDSVFDNTVYMHYWSSIYCQTYAVGSGPAYYGGAYYFKDPNNPDQYMVWGAYCHAPTVDGDYLAAYDAPGQQDRFTQEIRLSSQGDTLDWLVGLYYEDSNNSWQADFGFPTSNSYQDSVSLKFWEWYFSDTFPQAIETWYSQSSTDWEQKAVFGEATWHATEKLDITVGGRYFDRENNNKYYVAKPNGNPQPEYLDANGNLSVPDHEGDETEFVPKISAAYRVTDDVMVYGLWTEGFRPGGTNRTRGEPFYATNYDADKITNWEGGFKSKFAGGNARANLTAFYMDWEDYQLELVDPSRLPCEGGETKIPGVCGQPWQAVVANAGDAHIQGITFEFDMVMSESFSVGMNAQWLEAETDSTLDLNGDGVLDVQKGNELPIVPEWKASAWATYFWPVNFAGATDAYARLQWSYQSESNNRLSNKEYEPANPQIVNDSYSIGDFSVGMEADTWEVSLFVNNITDERAQYTHQTGTMIAAYGARSRYTNRPREWGVRFTKHFGD